MLTTIAPSHRVSRLPKFPRLSDPGIYGIADQTTVLLQSTESKRLGQRDRGGIEAVQASGAARVGRVSFGLPLQSM